MMAGGSLGWKMHKAMEKRKFKSEMEQLLSQLSICRHFALNMQADWTATLYREGKEWIFEAICSDHPIKKKLPRMSLHFLTIVFEGKSQDSLSFNFFASGAIFPHGEISFYRDKEDLEPFKIWKIPSIFQVEEGDGERELGPVHPDELI